MVDESIAPARWHGPVPDTTIATVEVTLGHELPSAWRAFVQREQWLEEGWLESGAFIQLWEPSRALDLMLAWGPSIDLHPGLFVLGGDGSREMYCINLQDPGQDVLSVDLTSSGWNDAEPLNLSVEQFIPSIDLGTLRPTRGLTRRTNAVHSRGGVSRVVNRADCGQIRAVARG